MVKSLALTPHHLETCESEKNITNNAMVTQKVKKKKKKKQYSIGFVFDLSALFKLIDHKTKAKSWIKVPNH